MDNGNDVSSPPLSFASSSNLSASISYDVPSSSEAGTNLELLSLTKLSRSLEKLLTDNEYDYADAEIEVEGINVGVNRCILAARSEFFHQLFRDKRNGCGKDGRAKYVMKDLIPDGRTGYEAFVVILNYLYTGKVKASPTNVSTCIDESCPHDACGPAINYAVEMMYASATFQIKELVMVFQRRLLDFVDKAYVEDLVPILTVAFRCGLKHLLAHCLHKVARSDLDTMILERELPIEVLNDVKSLRLKPNQDEEHGSIQVDPLKEKYIRRIHQALDSNDVALVKLLLEESKLSLDAACVLHYAAAYCNRKTVTGVLSLGNADVTLRNARGYNVLHVAARRKNPYVVVRVLDKGANVLDTTADGRTPITICRRSTRPKEFNEVKEHGQDKNTDKLCIEVLEVMQRNPLAGNVPFSSMMVTDDDLFNWLLLLENRVAMARALFPLEAKLAMEIADADSTTEFDGLSATNGVYGKLKEADSSEIRRFHLRLQALQKTEKTGRRFFPNCSAILDELSLDDTLGPLLLERGTPEEQQKRKARYMEVRQDVDKAFSKDQAEQNWASLPSCSSSRKDRKKRKRT